MAKMILILGESSTGKSSSFRDMPPEETIIISPNGKDLPFPSKGYERNKNFYVTKDVNAIVPNVLNWNKTRPNVKYIILDDFFHFLNARVFSPGFMSQKSGNAAFQKWEKLGGDVYQALVGHLDELRDDLYIIVSTHTALKNTGLIGMKTSGQLLDNSVDVPSFASYTFHTVVQHSDNAPTKYKFLTNTDGERLARTPHGCFDDLLIPNNLMTAIEVINDYRQNKKEVAWVE
jgi:hypothetical protein